MLKLYISRLTHCQTQLDKRNEPYQLDKLNKPHSLADEMFQTSTQLDKHNEPYQTIDQQSLHKTVWTPQREPTRQTRLTGKASPLLDKVNRQVSPNTVKSANHQLNKHWLY